MFKDFAFVSLLCTALAANWCCDPPTDRQAMLNLLVKDNNEDGDGFVSTKDMKYDMNNNYDTDPKDGKVTVYEWVKRANCRYGNSYEFAEWVFHLLTNGSDVVDLSALKGPADPGIPLAAFRTMNEQVRWYYCNALFCEALTNYSLNDVT